ncbi:MAG: response regulator [Planctomycetes bacterium]|nr:response regulator [Planctomycetota bacterium]
MTDRKTILVVDDIPLMRTILGKYVKGIGIKILTEELGVGGVEIIEASNGRVALDRLREREVDLIFLDLMMPEMDGLAFLKHKQEDPKLSGIPVIVCSALGEKETVNKARELGAMGYIVKPFTLKAVEEKFREVMAVLQR